MGAIYVGKKLGPGGFEKEVVLKQLLPEYTARPEFRDLFFREAKISATLDHANIVHTFDLVQSEESLFIVMEYVRGVDLRTIIRRSKLKRRELARRGCAAHRPRDAVGAGLRPRPQDAKRLVDGHHSPRRLPFERPLFGAGGGEAFGLRHRQGRHPFFGILPGAGQGRVHVARAGPQPADRPPHRSVFGGGVPLRGAHLGTSVHWRSVDAGGRHLQPADRAALEEAAGPAARRSTSFCPRRCPSIQTIATRMRSPLPRRCGRSRIVMACCFRRLSSPSDLRFILGRDPLTWLSEERPAASGDPSTQKLPAKELEGKEASSIGARDRGLDLVRRRLPQAGKC